MPIANCNMVLIALGANIAPSISVNAGMLSQALRLIEAEVGVVHGISRFWQTPAFPRGAGPDFVNACACLESAQPPEQILTSLHRIEAALGRQRVQRWGARSIDLDLLAVGALVLPDVTTLRNWIDLPAGRQRAEAPDRLILPHPRLQDRAFVLAPLAEIVPDWVHPLLGRSVAEMRDALDPADLAAMQPLERIQTAAESIGIVNPR